jgi:hypothetical protein
VKTTPIKEEIETFWKERYGENIQCNEEFFLDKNIADKIQIWNAAQYLEKGHNSIKNEVKLENSFKTLSCKFLASVIHNNTQIFSRNF